MGLGRPEVILTQADSSVYLRHAISDHSSGFLAAQRWFPADAWASFFSRFATSPAIAGLFARAAALLGAKSLANQLKHSKEKGAYDAWWQQFEWVTERTISNISDPKSKTKTEGSQLPPSLAFDLMNSLQRSAELEFQKDAVGGVLKHYLKEFTEPPQAEPDQVERPAPQESVMDEAAARSLRNLIRPYPESSAVNSSARTVLDSYNYEKEISQFIKAKFSHGILAEANSLSGQGLIVSYQGNKFLIAVKFFQLTKAIFWR